MHGRADSRMVQQWKTLLFAWEFLYGVLKGCWGKRHILCVRGLEAPDWAPLFLQKSEYEQGILTQNRQWAGILQASYFISEGLAGPPGIFFLQLVLTLLAKP